MKRTADERYAQLERARIAREAAERAGTRAIARGRRSPVLPDGEPRSICALGRMRRSHEHAFVGGSSGEWLRRATRGE